MTDHIPPSGVPPLESLAELIARSSFGILPEDVIDLDEMDLVDSGPEEGVLLRENIRNAEAQAPWWSRMFPAGSWQDDTETTTVFDGIGSVFPEADGSIRFDFSRFGGRTLYALAGKNRVLKLDAADARLPGGANRAMWNLFVATEQPCHSLLTYTPGAWKIEAAIRWRVEHAETALASGLKEITVDLLAQAFAAWPRASRPAATRSAGRGRDAQALSLRFHLEKSITSRLARQGIVCECSMRVQRMLPPAQSVAAFGMPGDEESATYRQLLAASRSSWVGQEPDRTDLGSMLRRVLVANSYTELPAGLRDYVRRISEGNPRTYLRLERGFAVLYECLRAELGMDSLTAEDKVREILAILADPPLSEQFASLAKDQTEHQFLDFLGQLAGPLIGIPVHRSETSSALSPFVAYQSSRELSPLERSVLELIDRGLTVDEVAAELGMDPASVEHLVRAVVERRRDGRYEFSGAP